MGRNLPDSEIQAETIQFEIGVARPNYIDSFLVFFVPWG